MSLAAVIHRCESVWFYMMGDVLMNSRLKDLYEFGVIHESYDPTLGDTDKPRIVNIEDSCYRVGLMLGSHNEDNTALQYTALFHLLAHLLVVTYEIGSKESISKLERLYSQIPQPPDRRIHFRDARPEMFVSMDRYPIILIGCRHPADGVREVRKEDIESFVGEHPGCIFAGECEPDDVSIQTVEKVMQFVIKAYHGFRKQAQEVEPVSKAQLDVSKSASAEKSTSKRRNRKCLLM